MPIPIQLVAFVAKRHLRTVTDASKRTKYVHANLTPKTAMMKMKTAMIQMLSVNHAHANAVSRISKTIWLAKMTSLRSLTIMIPQDRKSVV